MSNRKKKQDRRDPNCPHLTDAAKNALDAWLYEALVPTGHEEAFDALPECAFDAVHKGTSEMISISVLAVYESIRNPGLN